MIPLSSKLQAINEINVPTKVPDIRRFAGLVNYYIYIWCKRAHIIASLIFFPTKVNFKWTDVEIGDFISTKKISGRDALISYPEFCEIFIIHTDASKAQLGGAMIQNGNPIAFYSHKLTPEK